ncbi:MAG: hypothetical protein AVDCRST_MAG23-2859, partial [uncultured Sphingosinicella sp.]
ARRERRTGYCLGRRSSVTLGHGDAATHDRLPDRTGDRRGHRVGQTDVRRVRRVRRRQDDRVGLRRSALREADGIGPRPCRTGVGRAAVSGCQTANANRGRSMGRCRMARRAAARHGGRAADTQAAETEAGHV